MPPERRGHYNSLVAAEPEIEPIVRRVTPKDIIDLRHLVLRAGLPRESAIFEGDDDPDTTHFGAFAGEELVGCATILRNPLAGEPALQLRGMAVHPEWQQRGIGRRLLAAIDAAGRAAGIDLLWCNARKPATPFYRAHGWEIASEEFVVPTAGPHYKMIKRL